MPLLQRRRSLALTALAVATIATVVLVGGSATAQSNIRIIGSGGSDELIPPPPPPCDDLVFITEVSFDALGNPIDIPRFGTSPDLVQVFDVPMFAPVGPGTLLLDEVIVYDGHFGRAAWTPQLREQVWFEFLLDDVSQGRTPPTPDVPDGQRTGWHDLDMGSYELPNGADTLRIHHIGGDPAFVESLVVSALCGQLVPFEEPIDASTVPPTTDVPPTTEAPRATVAPTSVTPSTSVVEEVATTTTSTATTSIVAEVSDTTAPTTTQAPQVLDTEVEGQVEVRDVPQLAITGRTHEIVAILAGLIIALGAVLTLMTLMAAELKRGRLQ